MKILIDSREQLPYRFEGYGAITSTGCLPAGDYSLPGFEDKVSIERKSVDDLIGCLMGSNRERFEREMQKLKFYDLAAVVVEGSFDDLRQGRYRSQMSSTSAVQSVLAFMVRYRLAFVFAGNRQAGELVTYSLLSKFEHEIQARFKALEKAEKSHVEVSPKLAESNLGHPGASNPMVEGMIGD